MGASLAAGTWSRSFSDFLTDRLQVERRAGPLVAGLQRPKRILDQFAQLVPLHALRPLALAPVR